MKVILYKWVLASLCKEFKVEVPSEETIFEVIPNTNLFSIPIKFHGDIVVYVLKGEVKQFIK